MRSLEHLHFYPLRSSHEMIFGGDLTLWFDCSQLWGYNLWWGVTSRRCLISKGHKPKRLKTSATINYCWVKPSSPKWHTDVTTAIFTSKIQLWHNVQQLNCSSLCPCHTTADLISLYCGLLWIIASLFILANCQVQCWGELSQPKQVNRANVWVTALMFMLGSFTDL